MERRLRENLCQNQSFKPIALRTQRCSTLPSLPKSSPSAARTDWAARRPSAPTPWLLILSDNQASEIFGFVLSPRLLGLPQYVSLLHLDFYAVKCSVDYRFTNWKCKLQDTQTVTSLFTSWDHFQKERSLSKTDLIFKNRDRSNTEGRIYSEGKPHTFKLPWSRSRSYLSLSSHAYASKYLHGGEKCKTRGLNVRNQYMRQKDLDGCHEIVKVGESTAISATCDVVLNVFTNSEFTLFPTCVSMDFQSPPSE